MPHRYSSLTVAYVGVVISSPMMNGACGFVAPRVTSSWSGQRIGLWMTSSKKADDFRLELDNTSSANRSEAEGAVLGNSEVTKNGASPDVSIATEALEDATRVTESDTRRRSVRRPDPPPEISGLQTKSQRRRNLPLSQLKRVKPKRIRVDEEEGEFRPLVPKTDRESVLRGEDYWIDYRELDKEAARKKARTKAPSPDQFAQSKMRAEIVNPYKQNWILAISIAIIAVAGFIKFNPGILDESIITFPGEL